MLWWTRIKISVLSRGGVIREIWTRTFWEIRSWWKGVAIFTVSGCSCCIHDSVLFAVFLSRTFEYHVHTVPILGGSNYSISCFIRHSPDPFKILTNPDGGVKKWIRNSHYFFSVLHGYTVEFWPTFCSTGTQLLSPFNLNLPVTVTT